MESFLITKNNNAQNDLVLCHMQMTYPNFDSIKVDTTNISFYSTVAFTAQEQTDITTWYNALTTNDTCSAHTVKIYDYLTDQDEYDDHEIPKEIDYIRSLTQRLHPIITDEFKGEVREITYYESVTVNPDGSQTGTTPVVKEAFVYTRDTDKFAQSRVMTISWYKADGTEHTDTKTRQKYYTNPQAIEEGIRRRTNIINNVQLAVVGMLVQTVPTDQATAVSMGATFMDDYIVQIESYRSAPRENAFQDRLTADTTYSWLNNVVNLPATNDTIRDYILDQLDY